MSWRRAKGLADNSCPKCKGRYKDEEFDFDEDMCYFCLFPNASQSRPAEYSHLSGVNTNRTAEGQLLDEIEYRHHNNRLKKPKQRKK